MRLTVAMTTFNAGRHLAEQLASIEAQTSPPDEWLISDDCSTDSTPSELHSLSTRAEVDVRHQPANIGLRANIGGLLARSAGHVIVLADQDDVWKPNKLAAVRRAFAEPDVSLWFSDADLIDADGVSLGRTAWSATRFTSQDRRQLNTSAGLRRLLHGQTVTGATMAVRADVAKLALPLPAALEGEGHLFLHDGWLAVLAACIGRVVADPQPLVSYRQHADQTTSMSMTSGGPGTALASREQLRLDGARTRLVAARLAGVPTAQAMMVRRLSRFLDLRARASERDASPMTVLRAAPDYLRFARARTLAKDMLSTMSR